MADFSRFLRACLICLQMMNKDSYPPFLSHWHVRASPYMLVDHLVVVQMTSFQHNNLFIGVFIVFFFSFSVYDPSICAQLIINEDQGYTIYQYLILKFVRGLLKIFPVLTHSETTATRPLPIETALKTIYFQYPIDINNLHLLNMGLWAYGMSRSFWDQRKYCSAKMPFFFQHRGHQQNCWCVDDALSVESQ